MKQKLFLKTILLLCALIVWGTNSAWAQDTKTDIMFAKGFGGNTSSSYSAFGNDYSAVANSTNATGVTYAMQVFNGSNGQVKGSDSYAKNFSCRNTSTYEGYYISKVTLTVNTGTIDGSTSGWSVVYFGTSAYSNPKKSAPSGTATNSTEKKSGMTTLTWENSDESVSYFILYNLKTANNAYSESAKHPLTVEWTKKSLPTVTIGASKFSSVYYGDRALVVPEGLKAYTFKVNDQNKLVVSTEYDEGDVVAKDQAVVLYGNSGNYTMNASLTDGTKDANSVLRGYDESHITEGGSVYYRLTTKGNDPSTIGFYWGAENGGAFTVGAHKAYVAVGQELSFNSPSGARLAVIIGGESSGIDNVNHNENENVNCYNLRGQRVQNPGKGLYIVNGKKVLVK